MSTETLPSIDTTLMQRVEVSPIDLSAFRQHFVGEEGRQMMAAMCAHIATQKADVVIQPSLDRSPVNEHPYLMEVRTKWIGQQAVVECLRLQELLYKGTIDGLSIPQEVAMDRYFAGNINNLPSDQLLPHGVFK
jgi:hypothetical protein